VHYSTGSWIIGLGVAFLWSQRARLADRSFQGTLLLAILSAGVLAATWLGWALATYGPATTFLGNTTFALSAVSSFSQWSANAATNLASTLNPFLGPDETAILQQSSWLGQWRDHWFVFFQLKLPLAFGSAGAAVLLWQLLQVRRSPASTHWLIAVPVIVVLGTVTHTMPNAIGLTHIALQPLVLLGLAWLAARADRLPRWLSALWLCGLALDLALGLVLHFSVQSLWLERWQQPHAGLPEILMGYNWPVRANYLSKVNLHLGFLADVIHPLTGVAMLLGAGLAAVWLWRRQKD
jgi:hypothetical protein